MKNLLVAQSGGPSAAINATITGVIDAGIESGRVGHVYGALNGIKGVLNENFVNLDEVCDTKEKRDLLAITPAAALGSCRWKLGNPKENAEEFEEIIRILRKNDIGYFIYTGGNDSMDTVAKLAAYGETINSPIHFIGIPKTIDNDLMGTDHTPGFGSAAKYVASSMLEIAYDSSIYKLDAITIVEIMGRNAGWLTAASALARTECNDAPDLIYLPEVVFDKERFLKDIEEKFKEKSSIMIAVSEGIHDENGNFLDSGDSQQYDAFGHPIHFGTGKVLENICKEHFGCKVRSIELNVLQRCAMHIASKVDIDESFFIGKKAVETALANHTNVMMGVKRTSNDPYTAECIYSNVQDIANLEQKVPAEWITKEGNDITQELYDYLYPLIQGEIAITYKNGIPSYIDIAHLKEN